MAKIFQQNTERLAAALDHEDEALRDAAREALRGFLEKIVIPPGEGFLQVVGNFGEMLTAASGRDRSALSAMLVAGAGFNLRPLIFWAHDRHTRGGAECGSKIPVVDARTLVSLIYAWLLAERVGFELSSSV